MPPIDSVQDRTGGETEQVNLFHKVMSFDLIGESIAGNIPRHDLVNAMKSCKALYRHAAPWLYQTVAATDLHHSVTPFVSAVDDESSVSSLSLGADRFRRTKWLHIFTHPSPTFISQINVPPMPKLANISIWHLADSDPFHLQHLILADLPAHEVDIFTLGAPLVFPVLPHSVRRVNIILPYKSRPNGYFCMIDKLCRYAIVDNPQVEIWSIASEGSFDIEVIDKRDQDSGFSHAPRGESVRVRVHRLDHPYDAEGTRASARYTGLDAALDYPFPHFSRITPLDRVTPPTTIMVRRYASEFKSVVNPRSLITKWSVQNCHTSTSDWDLVKRNERHREELYSYIVFDRRSTNELWLSRGRDESVDGFDQDGTKDMHDLVADLAQRRRWEYNTRG